jgi:hypothetical protein
MKYPFLSILLCYILSVSGTWSQIIFEPGYVLTNSDEKVICLIKNLDWDSNPTNFTYKLNDSASIKTGDLSTIKEFGFEKGEIFKRKTVDIDRSSNRIEQLSNTRNPVFKSETLFLKQLVFGDANLYVYTDGNLKRFFYDKGDGETTQLVYKKFRTNGTKVGTNNHFRQQLLSSLECTSMSDNTFKNLDYKSNTLSKVFIDYNRCKSPDVETSLKPQRQNVFNLNIKTGVTISSSNFTNLTFPDDVINYSTETAIRFGLEAEYVLSFNKNKWSLFAEPGFSSYNGTSTGSPSGAETTYSYIDLPVGIKYYMFLKKDIKVFVSGAIVFDFVLDGRITRNDNPDARGFDYLRPPAAGAFGLGVKFKDRYIVESRYYTQSDLLGNLPNLFTEFQRFSILLGYTIF